MYGLYLCHANAQMHVYLIASFFKTINKCNVLLRIDSSQPGWLQVYIYMHFLGL